MARPLTESGRIELRVKPEEKTLLSRAAALRHEDLTGFILRTVLPAAEKIRRLAAWPMSDRPITSRTTLRRCIMYSPAA